MMKYRLKKTRSVEKILTLSFVLIFSIFSAVSGFTPCCSALNAYNISAQNPLEADHQLAIDKVLDDSRFLLAAGTIAKYYLEYLEKTTDKPPKDIRSYIEGFFSEIPTYLKELFIDLGSISKDDAEKIIGFNFEINGKKAHVKIRKAYPEEKRHAKSPDQRWHILCDYAFQIGPVSKPADTPEKDLKGQSAPETDPIIRELIKKGQIAEIYIDPEAGALKANRVRWVEGYRAGITQKEFYLNQEIDVRQLFTGRERARIEEWMRGHKVRGAPAKFRIALGNAALGWDNLIIHANIAHAGVRDGVIYTGGLLLKYLLREGNEDLLVEILDKDEYRHLRGLGHGTEDEYKRRLDAVNEIIRPVEAFKNEILNNNVKLLLRKIRNYLRSKNYTELLQLFDMYNQFSMGLYKCPVENRYPLKHAVALLKKEEQAELIGILTGPDAAEYRNLVTVDEILLMLDKKLKLKEWIEVHAPELIDRSVWQVSPEMWHEAGGLARVMQYHGVGIKELIENANVRFRQLEAHYQYRIDANGEPIPLDYAKDITHPVDKVEEVDRFTVDVGGNKVTAVVSRGVNDLGVEVFMIRDEQADGNSFYTHSLYNYKTFWGQDVNLPTWEDFSVFFSKASLKFIRRFENEEKKAIEKKSGQWRAPVVHTNDSQTALVSVYRKIKLDEAKEKKEKDPGVEIDPVLERAIMCFTTHTYRNRMIYHDYAYAEAALDFMGIPRKVEYRELFKHLGGEGDHHVHDVASAGLRTADWQGAVSWVHRDDVAIFDEWASDLKNPVTAQHFKELGLEVKLVGVANGDNREKSAEVFRNILKELFQDEADVEHPTPEQVLEAKKAAKKRLFLPGDAYYSSHDKPAEGEPILDPGRPVISYSGRLVGEKAGRDRALTDHNIRKLVEKGAQVVIYGNVQAQPGQSQDIAGSLIRLTEELKNENHPGKLIFVPRFSLKDQRELLAATDIQIQDSDERTEAAGYTESDVSACGGLQLAPPREGRGEGLLKAQGLPIDLEKRGEGNTLIPENWSPEAYLDILTRVLDMGPENIAYYQATSVRLSRILEARLTAAEYLRQFNYAVSNKKAKEKVQGIMEETRRKEEAGMELVAQLRPDPGSDPEGYIADEISRLVLNGETDKAIELVFTSGITQRMNTALCVFADTFNRLIKAYNIDKKNNGENIKNFTVRLAGHTLVLSEGGEDQEEMAKTAQIMAGQVLTIFSWIERGIKGAEDIRLTVDEHRMIHNMERGMSFIDAGSIPAGEVKEEGKCGFYWRGKETILKLGDNIIGNMQIDKGSFESAKNKLVMYIMDHGFVEVPEALREATENEKISTIHETFFVNDFLPGSYQTTSTGPGHFQGLNLDIKHVTEGRGIQFNVLYGRNGRVKEIIAHEIREGDWCLALPGYVDYMINLGGLRFNDISVELSPGQASRFNPDISDEEDVAELAAAAKEYAKYAPYTGMVFNQCAYTIKTRVGVPDAKWIASPGRIFSHITGKFGLPDLYASNILAKNRDSLITDFADAYNKAYRKMKDAPTAVNLDTVPNDLHLRTTREKYEPASLHKTKAVQTYIEDNEDFLGEVLGAETTAGKLIRIPVELIESTGTADLKDFLKTLQGAKNCYIELFSTENPLEVGENIYTDYGLIKEDLPDALKAENRNRTNTITLFPVFKDEVLPEHEGNKRWESGRMPPSDTIISPVGFNYDKAGIVRSTILGLRLSEIAGNDEYDKESSFVAYTLAQYMDLCAGQGLEPADFNIDAEDLIDLAKGNTGPMVASLNKLIKLLPIMPVNVEELRLIFECARKTLIHA